MIDEKAHGRYFGRRGAHEGKSVPHKARSDAAYAGVIIDEKNDPPISALEPGTKEKWGGGNREKDGNVAKQIELTFFRIGERGLPQGVTQGGHRQEKNRMSSQRRKAS